MWLQARGFYCLAVLAAVVLVGCGPGNPLGRRAVCGTVTLDGKPLPQGTVLFEPQGSEGAMAGASIADGKFSVEARRGLPPGTYLVRISAASNTRAASKGPPGSDGIARRGADYPVELIPPKWNSQSRQTVTVENDSEQFDFNITR